MTSKNVERYTMQGDYLCGVSAVPTSRPHDFYTVSGDEGEWVKTEDYDRALTIIRDIVAQWEGAEWCQDAVAFLGGRDRDDQSTNVTTPSGIDYLQMASAGTSDSNNTDLRYPETVNFVIPDVNEKKEPSDA